MGMSSPAFCSQGPEDKVRLCRNPNNWPNSFAAYQVSCLAKEVKFLWIVEREYGGDWCIR